MLAFRSPRAFRALKTAIDFLCREGNDKAAGKPTGPLDTLIAAQAVTRKLTFVSNNRKEFGRVPRLAIENWADRA